MAETVWKYNIPVTDELYKIDMPLGASIVHVDNVGDPTSVQVWAWIPDYPVIPEERWFRTVGTGHAVPPHAYHRGTVLCLGGALVWHLFEIDKQKQVHES